MDDSLNRVFFVDDEPHIREISQLALETVGGFEVRLFPSGIALLDFLTDETCCDQPDLIVLDINMPNLSGPETMKSLIQRFPDNRPVVVFLSAHFSEEEHGELIELGAAGVLEKPFDPMTLAEKLREIWLR